MGGTHLCYRGHRLHRHPLAVYFYIQQQAKLIEFIYQMAELIAIFLNIFCSPRGGHFMNGRAACCTAFLSHIWKGNQKPFI